jgi:hypothetical protein
MGFAEKMKKLHTVYYVCYGNVPSEEIKVVVEKGPPSLRWLSVNHTTYEVGN